MNLFKLQNVFVLIENLFVKTVENSNESEVVGTAGELEKFEGSMKIFFDFKMYLFKLQNVFV